MSDKSRLLRNLATVDDLFHAVIDDLADDEWDVRAEPQANTMAFDLWHMGRCRDWTLHTLILGAPEMVTHEQWHQVASPYLVTDGFAFTREQADGQGRLVSRVKVIQYADAAENAIVQWIESASEEALETSLVLEDRLRAVWPAEKADELIAFAPGLFDGPQPAWSVIEGIAISHNYGHVTELQRLKEILRNPARPQSE